MEEVPGNIGVRKGEPAQQIKKSQQEVAGTLTIETGAKPWRMTDNIGIQQNDPEKEDDDGIAIITSTFTLNAEHLVAPANEELEVDPPVTVVSGPAALPELTSYPVGRGISLPLGQLLPRCAKCDLNALICMAPSKSEKGSFLCLDHGLVVDGLTPRKRCSFISPEHKAAIGHSSPRCGTWS